MGQSFSYPDGPAPCYDNNGNPLDDCPLVDGISSEAVIIYLIWFGIVFLSFFGYTIWRSLHTKKSSLFTNDQRRRSLKEKYRPTLKDSKSATLPPVKDDTINFMHKTSNVSSLDSSHSLTGGSSIHSNGLECKLLPGGRESSFIGTTFIDDSVYENEDILIIPYQSNTLGDIVNIIINLNSLSLVMILLICIIDYYNDCQFEGIDNLCFFGNNPIFGSYDKNTNFFFAGWILSLFWFATLLVFKNEISVFIKLPCAPAEATHVHVWVKDEISLMSSKDVNPLVLRMREFIEFITPTRLQLGHEVVIEVFKNEEQVPYFTHEATRYIYSQSNNMYILPPDEMSDVTFEDLHSKFSEGLNKTQANKKLALYGQNRIAFERKSVFELMKNEFFTYTYLYQFLMYAVWLWFSYLFIGAVLLCLVIMSASASIYIQHSNEKTINELVKYETIVQVKRDGGFISISSNDLVLGDVIQISESDWVIPADIVLTDGSLVMNEAGLTGESMPVQKSACPNEDNITASSSSATKHTIFSGTTTLQVNVGKSGYVTGVVTAIGSGTDKGRLISQILNPEILRFRYEEEMDVVILLLLFFGIVVYAVSSHLYQESLGSSNFVTVWAYGMFTVSQIFSPLLPVSLKVGQVQSSYRLGEKGINCINPRRIAIAGKIRVFCFDKTGTITFEGMDFWGMVSTIVTKEKCEFADITNQLWGVSVSKPFMVYAMACCHSLARYNSDSYVGSEVEIKMFQATDWKLSMESSSEGADYVISSSHITSNNDGKEVKLTYLRKFQFDHGKQLMSVVVRNSSDNKIHVFCKGSFEKIRLMCKTDENAIPHDYTDVAQSYAMSGGYVLGIAHYELPESFDTSKIPSLTRDDFEIQNKFELLGLLVFRNEPKPESNSAITRLRKGAVRPVMITGDNAQCGQYIARQVNMIDKTSDILLAEWDKENKVPKWNYMGKRKNEIVTTDDVLKLCGDMPGHVELAVTGNATLDYFEEKDLLSKLIKHVRIFARMSPVSKTMLLMKFREIGLITGMCGDGGNDCGALRAAHAGIALSEAEASVVSPFTATTKCPSSTVDLVLEGRASLATSFANYKFLIMYGILFSVVKLASFYYGIIMAFLCYISIDAVAVGTLCYTMTLAKPKEELNYTRPTASLLGPSTVGSVLGVSFFAFLALCSCLTLMAADSDYVQWPSEFATGENWWTLSDNWENHALFTVMFLFLVASSAIFSLGYRYRQGWWKNTQFCINCFVLFFLATLVVTMDTNRLTNLFHMASFQFNSKNSVSPVWAAFQADGGETSPAMGVSLRLRLYFLTIFFIIIAVAWQVIVMEGFLGEYIKKKYPKIGRIILKH
jgi:cation-transporting ATPase 13A3/4/5